MKHLIGAFAFALATAANAASVSGTFSSSDGTGSFDLGPLSGYSVTGAHATFTFNDLSGYAYNGSSSITAYGSYNSSYYNTYQTNYYYNPLDAAQVSFGGVDSVGSNSGNYSHTATSSTSTSYYSYVAGYSTYWYSCGWHSTCTGISPYYGTGVRTDTVTSDYSGYTGGFTVSIDLTGGDWLSPNGTADFSFLSISGSSQLISASLDYSAVQVAAPVPEPETYAMMLAGLAALGMMKRRKAPAKKARPLA